MTDWYYEASALLPELTALRRELHRHPELSYREEQTAERIYASLRSIGLEPHRIAGTGVTALITGGLPGPTVGIRADMDALPITEATGLPFASENPGVMHACGHDVHMSAAVGAAKLLYAHRAKLRGSVKLLFQPGEEADGGAERMIAEGCMQEPDVCAVFGAHVSPALPACTVGIRFGKFYAASNPFTVSVHGKSAHGAEPENGRDALAAAAAMVAELRSIPESLDARAVVSVGRFASGTAGNIIADLAEFSGMIRTLGPGDRSRAKALFHERVERVSRAFGVNSDIRMIEGYPGVVNGDAATWLVKDTAVALFGEGAVRLLPEPTMTTEDFGYFIDASDGCYYHIGVGGSVPIHNPCFAPDERAIAAAAALHAAVAEAYLGGVSARRKEE